MTVSCSTTGVELYGALVCIAADEVLSRLQELTTSKLKTENPRI
jgi:hypothetical protein